MTSDTFSQWYIGIFGSLGFFLISVGNPWGFVAMLTTEPFWFISSAKKKQWGIFLLTGLYTVSCIIAIVRGFFLTN